MNEMNASNQRPERKGFKTIRLIRAGRPDILRIRDPKERGLRRPTYYVFTGTVPSNQRPERKGIKTDTVDAFFGTADFESETRKKGD